MGKGMAFFTAFGVDFLNMNWALNYGWKQRGRAILCGIAPYWCLSLFSRRRIFRAFPKQPKTQWNNKQTGIRLSAVHLMGIALGQPQKLADLASPPAAP